MSPTGASEWSDAPGDLPTKEDFDPFGGCLDAIHAWQNFGGLTSIQAFHKFCEAPDYYQEDFMFMGGVAFAYYFPVIERYILESRVASDESGYVESMSILAHCIKIHCECSDADKLRHLRQRCLDLANHVRNNLSQYSTDWEWAERQRIDGAWQELEQRLLSCE